MSRITPFFKSNDENFTLLQGDSLKLLKDFDFKFDMIFADPPYFLSNNGITCLNGRVASVNKGDWDKGGSIEYVNFFNKEWISLCREKLKEDSTIWISGTYHNIFSVANVLTELNFKILNVITWAKTNPPVNITCRYFTYSSEFIIWARKNKSTPHYFNYEKMKELNKGKQMKDVWSLPAIATWEKTFGKHPTQKPLRLLSHIILASTKKNAWILDPFSGSATTGIATALSNRKYLGIEQEQSFLELSQSRYEQILDKEVRQTFLEKILN